MEIGDFPSYKPPFSAGIFQPAMFDDTRGYPVRPDPGFALPQVHERGVDADLLSMVIKLLMLLCSISLASKPLLVDDFSRGIILANIFNFRLAFSSVSRLRPVFFWGNADHITGEFH